MGKVGRFLCDPIRAVRCALAERQSDHNEKKEALALLHTCENSPLAARTSRNSSTAHLLAPPTPPASVAPVPAFPAVAVVGARPKVRTMRSATLVRVVSHTTLGAAPAGSLAGHHQQGAKRPPLMSQSSTRSILKSSMPTVTTLEGGMRRGSRVGSAVSWTVPSLSQIGEDGMEGSSSAAGAGVVAVGPSSSAPMVGGVQVEEDKIIGGSLVRVRTKLFRRMSFSSGEEEFEEILVDGAGKQVIFVWGEGVDDIIS